MKTSALRTCLLWLMILMIPAQAIAGVFSAHCTATPDSVHTQHMASEHGDHPGSTNQADEVTKDTVHSGCLLCAVSCHGISALTSRNNDPFATLASALSVRPDPLMFVGQNPEPPQRPPRTALL